MQRSGSFNIKGWSGHISEESLASSAVSSSHKTEASDSQPSQEDLLDPVQKQSAQDEDALPFQINATGNFRFTAIFIGKHKDNKSRALRPESHIIHKRA